ncbi:MAG: PAS domain S-box protein [Acidobacteriia bacterium]|nr:PAS domain S-box protein [Terriglobia bacterium]
MMEFLKNLLASDFMAHGYCYLWRPEIVWLHVVSDALITLAYYSIPVTLVYFVRKRRDLPFHWMFLMFGAFILGCGTTHVMEVWTIWHGTYRLAGIIKLITAGLSVSTAVALVPLMPKALALPSPARLEAANRELEQEVRNRERAEQEIKELNESLERRAMERTAQLEAANLELKNEITQRKRAEDGFRLAVESVPSGMVMVNQEGKIVLVNAQTEKMFGYQRDELLGQTVDILVPNQSREAHAQYRAGFFAHLQARPMGTGRDLYGLRKDGSEFPVEVGLNPIETAEGTWVLSAIVDITERKRAEEEHKRLEAQMQHTQKLESLGVLAGGIAHDFNNLLVSILGNAGLALMDLAPESPARPTVKAIEAAALRTAELTKQLLAYSGKGKFLVQPLNLSRLVEEMAHLLKVSMSKRVVFRTRLAANLPAIEADAVQLQQVVMNLITNASEALGDSAGDVVVCTGVMDADRAYLSEGFLDDNLPEGRYVYLEVTDTGCGMDQETRSRIFDPFFTTKFTGRGLGLAAVLGIVRGHRGTIRLYSEPGLGTAFKVLFPASEQPLPPSERTETDAAWRGAGTILIVDDEEGVRSVARGALEKAGFTTMVAEDGHAAVELFRTHANDITAVLLDMTMPRMSGEEVFRAIRNLRPDAKVILSSGYNEQETLSLFQSKGLAGFIQKPYRAMTLIEKVREILAQADRPKWSSGNV